MNKKQLKRFFKGCWQSLIGSFYPIPPMFVAPENREAVTQWAFKRHWIVFLMPWKYMCIQANWKIAKKIYGDKK